MLEKKCRRRYAGDEMPETKCQRLNVRDEMSEAKCQRRNVGDKFWRQIFRFRFPEFEESS